MKSNYIKSKCKQNKVVEFSFKIEDKYNDPYNQVEVDAVFLTPQNNEMIVPSFWAGKNIWKVRYSSELVGKHKFIIKSKDKKIIKTEDISGEVNIFEYNGNNKLYKHGPIRISENKRHLIHKDGTPFFWLGDTWWYVFNGKVKYPGDFKKITLDRVKKGFTVVQLVAGFYPDRNYAAELYRDKGILDEVSLNEKGQYPIDREFKTLNPSFFDMADLKIDHLAERGIVPCIFSSWGYFLYLIGLDGMKKFWRYLVARWGAYPVVWCVAGEVNLTVINQKFDKDSADELAKNWEEIAIYLRQIDPYKRLMTVHPCPIDGSSYSSRDVFRDSSIIDIDMLQTGHGNDLCLHVENLERSLSTKEVKPVINGEVCYEGIAGMYWQDTQRFLFWTHILCGAAGHTYGSSPVVPFADEKMVYKDFFGNDDTWKIGAYYYKGSSQLGLAKRLFEKFEWFKFQPHPEWVSPNWKEGRFFPYCSGIPGVVRIIYIPPSLMGRSEKISLGYGTFRILGVEKDIDYIAYYFNPRTGNVQEKINIEPSDDGGWIVPARGYPSDRYFVFPNLSDWVLVMENKKNIAYPIYNE